MQPDFSSLGHDNSHRTSWFRDLCEKPIIRILFCYHKLKKLFQREPTCLKLYLVSVWVRSAVAQEDIFCGDTTFILSDWEVIVGRTFSYNELQKKTKACKLSVLTSPHWINQTVNAGLVSLQASNRYTNLVEWENVLYWRHLHNFKLTAI